ncbi:kinase-like domain-containing protein [Xylaria castorea]|nr:kinase-like domain-containing protein [Xylaria castorea]
MADSDSFMGDEPMSYPAAFPGPLSIPNMPPPPNQPPSPGPDQFGGAAMFPPQEGPGEFNQIVEETRLLAERTARETKNAFSTSKLWEFERTLGNGAYGITMLIRNKSYFARRPKRVVLKRSIRQDEGQRDLINEMDSLRALRGHAHIGQLIDAIEDVVYTRPRAGRIAAIARRMLGMIENPPENIFKILHLRRGPALILEYIENGSLASLKQKIYARRIQLPNRVLWSWFYCLTRACVGLTHEKENFKGGPLELETLQPAGEDHFPLEHRDIAARNLMIADSEPTVPEHQLVPKLVMIDFGIATWAPNAYYAQLANMYGISMVMMYLIVVDRALRGQVRITNHNGIVTKAGLILPNNGVDPFPRLDPDLRDLLVRTLNNVDAQRPELPQVFEEVRVGMMKDASAYPGNIYETDDYIRGLLQRLLNDA